MNEKFAYIHEKDNVIIALSPLEQGEVLNVNGLPITLSESIPRGHKVAIVTIEQGEDVIKYGFPIGKATTTIQPGAWVHSQNMKTKLEGVQEYDYTPSTPSFRKQVEKVRTFQGYVRDNGNVGIRNEIWIINTVGCINKTAERLAAISNETCGAGVDGVYHYPHLFGCSQLGDDLLYTQKILRNLVLHPNAAGVLVLGLGCENNHIAAFKQVLGDYDDRRVKFLAVQEADNEMEQGLAIIEELISYAKTAKREPIPLSKLKVGLKCGGSDGFSGITANPLVGAFSDKVVAHGGTTVMTEVPEMFGAETILMNRAKDQATFEKMVRLINDFKEYFLRHNQPVYENPSPGNKEGGITTLEEKSLGCVQKGGFAEVVDVLPYGERLEKPGLNLLQGPGNDLVSVTALAAAGAHFVLFTTGRGTPFGGPVPTVKISTNTSLYERKKHWIDFNAGRLVEGATLDEVAEELLNYGVKLASGEVRAKNEEYGFKEISIFKDGVIL
ncbi:altronate dehydratase family protein [Halalkalibacterium halodurans]|uniref:Altronate hydrolase n=1 Tax=Halalkalibacterium halodurans (strain ATCC BAA-125 / DSM 18197 / FERM 7344 / JCM 9153 / C-125) TaxID=272558 RepID=Q9KFI9_HALH5|nr:altronate dehydratase family protein [Halalkalibacterium halodurans]MDY7220988.1 altronate dehydratase family protein [Halalkalibacterium halodurans]MDY7240227.1 altronate dehydratase family protein [Halalkalibacterium halodurans]MED4079878.1 altronate dehydratase family protein [Halalkalibacterium halodurans]MED4085303.1 altronate dehydratase family protein [Halalkalibacterium halodurans]MED4103836.1 altronate dehydratase family protein [Halalkalibacterium halodurans]